MGRGDEGHEGRRSTRVDPPTVGRLPRHVTRRRYREGRHPDLHHRPHKVDQMSDLPNPDGTSEKRQKFSSAPPMIIDTSKNYTATMVTSKGTLEIVLDALGAPNTVNSFVYLARWHYYDGIVFHRVIPGFVLQGGDPTGTGAGGPGYKFNDELPKPGRYELGSLAMANAGPHTNGSQFFVISGPDGMRLPPLYALFGKVVKGLDVVEAINNIGTSSGKPREDVVIESVTITES